MGAAHAILDHIGAAQWSVLWTHLLYSSRKRSKANSLSAFKSSVTPVREPLDTGKYVKFLFKWKEIGGKETLPTR